MPRNQLLTETDGPFATDGDAPLIPWDADRVFPALPQLWNCSTNEAGRDIHANLRNLVGTLDHVHGA